MVVTLRDYALSVTGHRSIFELASISQSISNLESNSYDCGVLERGQRRIMSCSSLRYSNEHVAVTLTLLQ